MIKSIKLETGKEYRLFTSRMEVEVKTSRIHVETGYPIWMRVNGARVISQVIAAIADADYTEALDMNAAIEWAKITPEQRAIHDARVIFGISLMNKHNIDGVLEACHAEALEMNTELDKEFASIEALVPGGAAEKNRFKFIAAKYIVGATPDAAHVQALRPRLACSRVLSLFHSIR
ncbi:MULTISPECIES: hypothetical protein [Serratia]|uniref:hypothetical protein n=1 Tax=Serratia TaxID=613 RepID=UPI00065FCA52|nr:hypothetical protein [Serratia sp. 506_PEND]